MNIIKYIPSNWRKPIYGTFAVIGVVIGALHVAFASSSSGVSPEWLLIVDPVFAFLAGAIGLTAGTHTPSKEVSTNFDNLPILKENDDEELEDDD